MIATLAIMSVTQATIADVPATSPAATAAPSATPATIQCRVRTPSVTPATMQATQPH